MSTNGSHARYMKWKAREERKSPSASKRGPGRTHAQGTRKGLPKRNRRQNSVPEGLRGNGDTGPIKGLTPGGRS